jgi:hypothetical protein
MPPVGFEPTIPANARPQTYALDVAATGIGRPSSGKAQCKGGGLPLYTFFSWKLSIA